MFTSIPLTYVGGLVVGVGAALSTKYVASVSWLSGFPASLPFIILFLVLAVSPRRWLVDFAVERKSRVTEPRQLPRGVKVLGGVVLLAVMLRLPYAVGARLPVYTSALVYVLIFLSLALLLRTSGQVSLAQLAFAAVGGVASARLAVDAGLPWLVAVLLGALITVPVGAILAIPAIRQSGLYLALATFGFAVLLERLLYSTNIMFGGGSSVLAPRPSVATGDIAYFYVVLAFVTAALGLIAVLHRSRLGRLLRAMSDSPTALNSYGTSVTAIKVIVFCVSAFLAGLGGALLGPVTGTASPANFASFASLLLVVYYVAVIGTEIAASIGAAIALIVVPTYITSDRLNDYLPLLFGVFAAFLLPAIDAGVKVPPWLVRVAANARRRPGRHPATARHARRSGQEAT
jgi:ABC-type branched-subunit amino acid transport system permease subunit